MFEVDWLSFSTSTVSKVFSCLVMVRKFYLK